MSDGKIDFVVTWVDGSDPEWRARKHLWENGGAANDDRARGPVTLRAETSGDSRYRDYGTLKYWFRAVEAFAPWVNRVFLVTCGQKPDWLNEAHPKLRLVNHADYIPAEYLPTFHSDTIELNLHRIPELSERFVLFNDDMFLLRPASPGQFFRDGLPVLACDLAIPKWLGYSTASRVVLNNGGVLKRHFDVERVIWRHIMKFVNVPRLGAVRAVKNLTCFAVNRMWIPGTFGHLMLPHLKSTFEAVWREQPNILDRTSRSRFRIDDGVSHWLMSGWNILKGDFVPTNEKRNGETIVLEDGNIARTCRLISRQMMPQICINDSDRISDLDGCFRQIVDAFRAILPEKSRFEK